MPPPWVVLLIEDDEIDREMVHRLLDLDYVVHEATTGNQALLLLKLQAALVDLAARLGELGQALLEGLQLSPLLVALGGQLREHG